MKKGVYIFLFVVFLLLPLINAYTVTGAATSQETGVSVFVLPPVPILNIISPTATTYDEGEYILLDYQEILMDTVWYNLDNGANITINSSFYFLTTVGTHTLYLYGNQSNGTISTDQVTFTVQGAEEDDDGRGRVRIDEKEINITLQDIYVELKQGETKEVRLLVQNDHDKTTSITLEDQNLNNLLISLSETVFSLNPGESKEIVVTFLAGENKDPEIYLEKIIIKTDNSQKDIYFYVEVESKDLLFDVRVDIPKEPRIYQPGEEIIANIDLFNLGQGEADLDIEYLVKDLEGNIIFGEKQILIIGASINLVKVFRLPENIEEGEYIFYVKATYQGKTAIASKGFRIVVPSTFEQIVDDTFSRITEGGANLVEKVKQDWDLLLIALIIFIGSFIVLGLIEKILGTRGIYYLISDKTRFFAAGKRRKRKVKNAKRIIRSKKKYVRSRKGLLRLVLEKENKKK